MLSRARWVFGSPFCALAEGPQGDAGVVAGQQGGCPSIPLHCKAMGPGGRVGAPTDWHPCLHRFPGMNPTSVWPSMTSGLQGRFASVLGPSIPMYHPSGGFGSAASLGSRLWLPFALFSPPKPSCSAPPTWHSLEARWQHGAVKFIKRMNSIGDEAKP